MKISELMEELNEAADKHGDLEVLISDSENGNREYPVCGTEVIGNSILDLTLNIIF